MLYLYHKYHAADSDAALKKEGGVYDMGYVSMFEKNRKNSELIHEFLKKNEHVFEKGYKGSCSRYGVEFVRLVNGFYVEYSKFQKISYTTLCFLKRMNVDRAIVERLFKVMSSVKSQWKFLYSIKKAAKLVPITRDEYVLFCGVVDNISERIKRLSDTVVPEYLKITPAYSYIKELEEEGKSFFEEVDGMLDFSDWMQNSEENINNYLDYIDSHCHGDEWLMEYNRYNAFQEKRLQIIEDEKQTAKKEKQEQKALESREYIEKYSRDFYRQFMAPVISEYPYVRIGLQVNEFNKKNQRCKAIIFIKSGCKSHNRIRFYSESREDLMGPMSKATVVEEGFCLPHELMEKVEGNVLSFCEVMLN